MRQHPDHRLAPREPHHDAHDEEPPQPARPPVDPDQLPNSLDLPADPDPAPVIHDPKTAP